MTGRTGFTTADPGLLAQPRGSAETQPDPGVFPTYPILLPSEGGLDAGGELTTVLSNKKPVEGVGRLGYVDQHLSAGVDFFERPHVRAEDEMAAIGNCAQRGVDLLAQGRVLE